MLDKNRKEISKIRRGDEIIVSLEMMIRKPNQNDFVAVQLLDKNTQAVICGNNTKIDKIKISWKKGENKILFVFNEIFLNRGEVYIKVFLKRDKDTLDIYDGYEKNEFIEVVPKDERAGIVYVDHKWITEN